MNAVKFNGCNITVGSNQPQYQPLPAYRDLDTNEGRVVFCWRLSWRERLAVLFAGVLWHEVLTFGRPLQPQKLGLDKPTLAGTPEKI